MIPKIIHYIWFGGSPLPELAQRCIASWRKYCPDYEIICWNESNFDIGQNDYCLEAYKAKKWAFVSDYARLSVLVNCGGVYMDTDVEVVRSLDGFLMHEAFSGFESTRSIPTGIMACRKGYPLFRRLLAEYEKRHFVGSDGAFDLTTNVEAITSAVEKLGFIPNNEFQIVDGFALYPSDWFCPKSYETGLVVRTDNTHAIHHFAGSWLDASEREILRLKHDWMSRFPNMNVKVATMAAKIEYGLKHKDPEPLFLSAKRRLPGFGVAKEAAEKRNA